ncbi:hypothetical protein [Bradyrhizobium sp. SZCCHNS2096]|uniref:hypothetical protein n=1 Tax=Bradyrhizobium sp. SZCCHNS2096 TaxID=3057309 RepID=UPI002915EE36|nr:hypothetical protein [Bradyrhizobium sp. SZCCHNS2096]
MTRRRWSLQTAVFLGGATLIVVTALAAAVLYSASLQRRGEELAIEQLRTRGELSASLLARQMYSMWIDVSRLAAVIDPADIPEARRQIQFVSQLEQRYAWLGIADPGGKVIASKDGMAEGRSVADLRWFRQGLGAPTAVDDHESEALERLLQTASGPYRFIAMSAPLMHDGAPAGVIGAQIDWKWVIESVAALASRNIDLVLLSRDGIVLFGAPDLVGKPLTIGSAQAASRGASVALIERWPDGKDYFTVTIPTVGYADLPSFGWSLLIRQDAVAAMAPTRELVRSFWFNVAGGVFSILVLLNFAAQWVVTPLRRLAHAAEAMVKDPFSGMLARETRYDEATRLRDALVRLQSKLMGKVRSPPEDSGSGI